MSIHKSLRTGAGLVRHRNVLTREERLRKLEEDGKWNEEENSLLGLPKVRNIKILGKKKKPKKEEEEGEAAPAAADSSEAKK